jgi:D-glycero-beta-D-manno-heptose 1-phosphate adenylyltransferase
VNFRNKVVALENLAEWRRRMADSGKKLAVTNGCFDLLHLGHVTYLENARNEADALLVGVNGDDSVRALKGPNRPINTEEDRAAVLAALECVDAVCIFPEKRAARFLGVARPDVYAKGGDYTVDSLDAGERAEIEGVGGRIVILPMVAGKSTTGLVKKLQPE